MRSFSFSSFISILFLVFLGFVLGAITSNHYKLPFLKENDQLLSAKAEVADMRRGNDELKAENANLEAVICEVCSYLEANGIMGKVTPGGSAIRSEWVIEYEFGPSFNVRDKKPKGVIVTIPPTCADQFGL